MTDLTLTHNGEGILLSSVLLMDDAVLSEIKEDLKKQRTAQRELKGEAERKILDLTYALTAISLLPFHDGDIVMYKDPTRKNRAAQKGVIEIECDRVYVRLYRKSDGALALNHLDVSYLFYLNTDITFEDVFELVDLA